MRGLAATQARPKRLFSQAKVIHDKIVHFFELDMSLALYFAQKLLRKAKLSRGSARTAKSCSKRQKLLNTNTLHSCRILAPPHPLLANLPRPKDPLSHWIEGNNMQMAGEGLARVRVHVLSLFIVVFTCWKFSLSYKECKKIDGCSCLTDEGEVSLKKLAETGTPRWDVRLSADNGRR